MNTVSRDNWSFQEDDRNRQLIMFGFIGLKKGAKAFMGPDPNSLVEANDNIGAGISAETARLIDSHGLARVQLNCHTAMMLFLENFLRIDHLMASSETTDSISVGLFGVEFTIQENPGLAIAYFDSAGRTLAA